MESNYVDTPMEGFVIALQYWSGDAELALRLARLLADIEAKPRCDVALALCRRADCPDSPDLQATLARCREKIPTMALAIKDPMDEVGKEPRTSHPDGANALWAGTVWTLAEQWQAGHGRPSVFTIEHDGCPLSVDWIDRLRIEHDRALANGKRVTGCLMDRPGPGQHVNGSMLLHLSMWVDRPSIHVTPNGQAWDVFHRVAFASECQPSNVIKNIYSGRGYGPGVLGAIAKETAWLASSKDDSPIHWAERTLVSR
jgi:hypothetical protein